MQPERTFTVFFEFEFAFFAISVIFSTTSSFSSFAYRNKKKAIRNRKSSQHRSYRCSFPLIGGAEARCLLVRGSEASRGLRFWRRLVSRFSGLRFRRGVALPLDGFHVVVVVFAKSFLSKSIVQACSIRKRSFCFRIGAASGRGAFEHGPK